MEKFCQVIYLLTKFMLKFIHFDFRIEKFIYLYQNVSSIIYIDAYAITNTRLQNSMIQ